MPGLEEKAPDQKSIQFFSGRRFKTTPFGGGQEIRGYILKLTAFFVIDREKSV
ncbi:hypothetical protein [uncultured Sutterella sp.]|uniref:hypothetical protein n=1 Tax=uncultured Sutterella sp. TaxID=286133 RepID=UPI00263749E8|nr:hypothetical protein [uncultured Sutterella sp.]